MDLKTFLINANFKRSQFSSYYKLFKRSSTKPVKYQSLFVTVSRQPGSGGKLIAQKVAQALGYKFWDEHLIDEVGKLTKTKREYLKALDEKEQKHFADFIQSLLSVNYINPAVFNRYLNQVIQKVAREGKAVILGRGANFITSHNRGLHVRIVASYDQRVKNTHKYNKVPKKEAAKLVSTIDAGRTKFVRETLSADINDQSAYDLIINTDLISVDDAVKIALEAFKRKFHR